MRCASEGASHYSNVGGGEEPIVRRGKEEVRTVRVSCRIVKHVGRRAKSSLSSEIVVAGPLINVILRSSPCKDASLDMFRRSSSFIGSFAHSDYSGGHRFRPQYSASCRSLALDILKRPIRLIPYTLLDKYFAVL